MYAVECWPLHAVCLLGDGGRTGGWLVVVVVSTSTRIKRPPTRACCCLHQCGHGCINTQVDYVACNGPSVPAALRLLLLLPQPASLCWSSTAAMTSWHLLQTQKHWPDASTPLASYCECFCCCCRVCVQFEAAATPIQRLAAPIPALFSSTHCCLPLLQAWCTLYCAGVCWADQHAAQQLGAGAHAHTERGKRALPGPQPCSAAGMERGCWVWWQQQQQ